MIDINSQTWKNIESWAEKRVEEYKNDALSADSLETLGVLKGSVWVLEDLINLKNERSGDEEPQ